MNDYKYLGDLSAAPPWHTRHMECDDCEVYWDGCWDNFQCPKCGQGELPNSDFTGIVFGELDGNK